MFKRIHFPFLLALILTTGLAGCKRSASVLKPDPEVSKVSNKYEPLEVALVRDEKFQPYVKMMANAEGETVTVQIQNFSEKMLGVDSVNFGVIRESESREVHPFDPEVHTSTFPKIGLKKGEIATGNLTFTGMGNLAGERLVFKHSQVRPSLAYITGEGAAPRAVPRKK